jgi:hypothetical protein
MADEEQKQEEAKEEKPRPEPRVPVRVIGSKGESALVEWIDAEGLYQRIYVPLAKVTKGTVASKDLERGIPYGLPWEEYIEVTATPASIANELRRMGAWRREDLTNSIINHANKAFDRGAFLRRVEQEVKK